MSGSGGGGDGEEEIPWPRPALEPDPGDEPLAGAVPVGDEAGDGAQGAAGPGEPGADEGGPPGRRAARTARVRRRRRVLVGLVGALLVLVLAFVLWYELEEHALGPAGRQVVVTVRQGESADSVISALSHEGVIGSSFAFRISDLFHGTPNVLPGDYAMDQNLTFAEVRARLAAGPNVFAVVVHPGYTLAEVAARVDSVPGHTNGEFARVAASGAVHSAYAPPGSVNLEGLLGTGQYLVLPGESDQTLLSAMVQRFDRDARAVGLDATSAAAFGMTPYQVITAASVVEKEGYYTFNMPKVARVILNRLAQGKPLQMDSTVLYAIGQDGGPVTKQTLEIQSPYNTYLHTGLPPTPICMPSTAALAAAVHPPAGAWLYFTLVDKNGTMAFSDTYAEQLANEKLAQSRGVP